MHGLTRLEVQERRERFGLNEVREKSETKLHRLFKKLWGPIPWLIEAAAILSAILGDWVDLLIILSLLVVNVAVDYIQEGKAASALAKIQSHLAKKALVFRDGAYQVINARELVPDDVVKLKIGDIVPADAVLLSGEYLQVDQSALTGESLSVNKKSGDEIYSGSIIKRGEMTARITAIGSRTFSGKNMYLVERAQKEETSHFQKAIIHIGRFLIILSIVMACIVLLVSTTRHDSLIEDLRFVLVLLVASIPVALPAVLSVTMAVGALTIAKKNAIVKNIAAIEELAGTDILCSDKTGTLTQNKLSISTPILYNGHSEGDLFYYASLTSSRENNDPIEAPIYEYIEDHFPQMDIHTPREKFEPFDPAIKIAKTVATIDGRRLTAIKGATQIVSEYIEQNDLKKIFLADIEALAKKGYRSLAVGYTHENHPFTLVGIIPFFDPPRDDSAEVINKVRSMGVNIKMLTGDNQSISQEVARILELGTNILPISQLRAGDIYKEQTVLAQIIAKGLYKKLHADAPNEVIEEFGQQIAADVQDHLSKAELHESYIRRHESEIVAVIENADGFSEVLPEDKYFIIDELQKNKHFVAMTGDGVNDSPALKKADVGIAVFGATDAARAASDLVLLTPGLSIIQEAMRMARQTFERMKGYATFRIAETIRIILFISLAIIVFNYYPITAVMIIMLALLNDIPVMMIAYDNAPDSDKPVHWNMGEVLTVSTVLGVAGVISSFLLFSYLQWQDYPLALIQTMIFLKLDVSGHSTLYLTRTGRRHFWEKPYPALKFFLPAFSTRIIGTVIAVLGIFMEPISLQTAAFIWIYATAWWLLNDFLKIWSYKLYDHYSQTKMSYHSMKAANSTS
jgi:H+-transporting ATPase